MTLPPATDPRAAANAAFRVFLDRRDPAAIADLFDLCAPGLRRTAMHLVGDAATADDLVQITFLAALQQRTFDRERDVEPWLAGILRNQAALVHRRRARAFDRDRLPAEGAADPRQLAADRETLDEVERAIAALPAPLQPVVRLHVLHGLAAGEIAASLTRPGGTVRTQLMRGLQRLRELLPVGVAGVLAGLLPAVGLRAAREVVVAEAIAAGRRAGIGAATAAAWWLQPRIWWLGLVGSAAVAVAGAMAWPREEPAMSVVAAAAETTRGATDEALAPDRVAPPPSARVDAAPPPSVATAVGAFELRGIVRNADGAAAGGVEVLLWATAGRPVARGSTFEPAPAAMAVTGADGAFVVRGTGEQCYLLARGDGTVSVHAIAGRREGRAAIDGIDLVLGPVVEQRGELLDDRGQPVPRFAFGTHRGGMAQPWDRLAITGFARADLPFLDVVTDDAGRFAVGAVAVADYLWEVQHPDHPMLRVTHRPADGPLTLRLAAGEVVHGVVRRADGSPARGALVHAYDHPRRKGVCRDDGTFTLRGIARRAQMMLTVDDAGSAILCAALPAAGTPCELRLEPPRTLAGRLVDASGAPVVDAEVHIVGDRMAPNDVDYTEPDTWEFQFGRCRAQTDADGAFVFERLYDGMFEVRVRVPGATDEVAVAKLRAGAPRAELRLADVLRRMVAIRGTIRDGVTGEPLRADIVVWRKDADGNGATGQTAAPEFTADGYRLPGLAAGELRLEFRAAGHADDVQLWRTFAPGEQVVDAVLYPVRSLEIRASRDGAPVQGRVSARIGSEPLPISNQPGSKRSSIELTGGAARADGLPARRITIVVDGGGGQELTQEVDLTREPIEPLRFEFGALPPLQTIAVIVLRCEPGFDGASLGAPTEREWLERALATPGVALLDVRADLRLMAGADECGRGLIEPLPSVAKQTEEPAYRAASYCGNEGQEVSPEPVPAVAMRGRGDAFTLVVAVAGKPAVRIPITAAALAARQPIAVFVPR